MLYRWWILSFLGPDFLAVIAGISAGVCASACAGTRLRVDGATGNVESV